MKLSHITERKTRKKSEQYDDINSMSDLKILMKIVCQEVINIRMNVKESSNVII